MGYNPKTIDRDKRMALTKTIRFQHYAQRMGEALEFPRDDGMNPKGSSSKVVGERAKGMSKNANLIKSIYKYHKLKKEVKEELYDHEKDDKGGNETYGKKPKFAKVEGGQKEDQSDSKSKAAAVLTGGTTLTGQKRDDVEFDPMLNRPNTQSDASGMQIKADKKKINR
jgi:hypothetical protein